MWPWVQPMNQNQIQDRDWVQSNISDEDQAQIRMEVNN